MGHIRIKIPQKINKAFQIDSRKAAEEIIKDLERRSHSAHRNESENFEKFKSLKKLVDEYRAKNDSETAAAIEISETWRNRWNR